ncbi:uncharacterized protein LOC128460594 [Pleuronectes platessa]|uniref:uncharacterized protein LOC128460594 n=1 Tax=Pleuronectes platessa TaxID=8262 RepID=UPI00232A41F3|nr:uncharacterized protein LOC128460594 [Pleuronectes platessa]
MVAYSPDKALSLNEAKADTEAALSPDSPLLVLPITRFKYKFGLPDATELDAFDETNTVVEEDIFSQLVEASPDMPDTQTLEEDIILEIQIDPGPNPTTQDDISEDDHSTSSSLTDTNTSLSSSDNDPSSRIENGIPIGRRTSSSEVIPRPATEVSESEAAKQMVKNALLCKPGGEDVIEEYKAEKSLTHSTRRKLVNLLASHMTESHRRMPSRKHKEKYALGIITLFPSLKDPFSPKGYLNQDFLLLFGAETASFRSKVIERGETSPYIGPVINEAKHLTQSIELSQLLKAAEKLTVSSGRKRTKISPSNAVDKMLHFHKSCCSLDEHLRRRDGRQPYFLAVGRTRNRIDTFYIVVDKQLIPCQSTSLLGAFDELFKSHYLFNLSYDEYLGQVFTFVQTTVYNIDVATTNESPRVREFRAIVFN